MSAPRNARRMRKTTQRKTDPQPHLVLVPSPKARDAESVTVEEFCARMKAAREHRGLTLASIAGSTKIPGSLFEAFERGDLSRWPKGIYRRAYFRDYVMAIGLPVEPAVREFLRLFPDEEEAFSIRHLRPAARVTFADRIRWWCRRRR